ncbi:MAG: SCO family protein [Rhodospirillaceae bacterium]|nr:MAG: SCO family protein [Rhodospirillaceae bacterium]
MSRILFIVLAAVVFVGAVIGGKSYFADSPTAFAPSGKVNIGGPFSLVDHNGKAVTEQDYKGKYMLIYFGYTFCPDVCPTSLSIMGDALDMLTPAQLEKVVPIFVTVDPERDTPEIMAGYVPNFHEKLVGLTGSLKDIKAAAKRYKVFFAKANEDDPDGLYTMDHGSTTYLMDPNATYAAHFSHGTPAKFMAEKLAEFL